MVDYSKWDFIEDDDEELKTPSSPRSKATPAAHSTSGPSPDLMRQLAALKSEDPDKLKELEKELEVMKAQALDHKSKSMAQGGNAGHATVGAGGADTAKASNVKAGIKSQADVLKQSMAALDQKKKDMEAQMAQLEQLAAAGDGESVMRFFESQGLTPTDIQRMMGGSEADTAEVLGGAATKNANDGIDNATSDNALNFAEQLDSVVRGDDLPTPPEVSIDSDEALDEAPMVETPQVSKTPPIKQRVIPEHMQQLGKEGMVIMIVRLPKLENAAGVQLDVAPRAFKLRAEIPGEDSEYVLSLELGSTVDPASSKAKWKKKESSLRIELSPPSRSSR